MEINTGNTEYTSFNQDTTDKLKILQGDEMKKVNDLKYLGSYVSSTVKDVNIRLKKSWTALNAMKYNQVV